MTETVFIMKECRFRLFPEGRWYLGLAVCNAQKRLICVVDEHETVHMSTAIVEHELLPGYVTCNVGEQP